MQDLELLINKYNQAVPRYTSYPTVPFWKDWDNNIAWKSLFKNQALATKNDIEGYSIYIHLPFCESLCTYCACNKKITTNHSVEEKYINAVLKEWELYKDLMGESKMPLIQSIHLGGGTPTFFSPNNLEKLIKGILKDGLLTKDVDFSIEGHPNNTTIEHLQVLYNLGFKRISYGVQDLDPVVQNAINRFQPLQNVLKATEEARKIGFESVNFDLIYGLPFQTLEGMKHTIQETIKLKPDRVAFYSYAHVPWKQKVQRLFDERDLPEATLKSALYFTGKKMFLDAGYVDIGMDHFSLPTDQLFMAREEGRLHRNFMGYTDIKSAALIGLGVSAISDIGGGYAQNYKEIESYYRAIEQDELPVNKGYFMNDIDLLFKQYILNIICKGSTTFKNEYSYLLTDYTFPILKELETDQLIKLTSNSIEVTPLGFNFLRNICKAFDIKWLTSQQTNIGFSKAV